MSATTEKDCGMEGAAERLGRAIEDGDLAEVKAVVGEWPALLSNDVVVSRYRGDRAY